MKIAIAGAGIAGLATATFLARQGHNVTIYDQFDTPRPVGSGLMIQPVGLAVLADLGLGEAVRSAASPIGRIYGETIRGRPVLDVPVPEGRVGIIVAAGLNPIAAVEEAGIPTESHAMAELYEFGKLQGAKE